MTYEDEERPAAGRPQGTGTGEPCPVPASACGRFGVLLLLSSLLATGALPTASASAAVLGGVGIRPTSGTDQTLFFGEIGNALCPAGTLDSYFEIFGRDIGLQARAGSGDLGFLGQGTVDGRGRQSFTGASIANLKTTNTGAFARSGSYRIRFGCIDIRGRPTDSYERVLDYVAGGRGAFTVRPSPPAPPGPPGRPASARSLSPAEPAARATGRPGASPTPSGVAPTRPPDPLTPTPKAPSRSAADSGDGPPVVGRGTGPSWGVPVLAGLAGLGLASVGLRRRRRGATTS